MFLDRVFHECESQACAGIPFGRKEGLGYSGQVRRSDHPKPANEYHLKTGQQERRSGHGFPQRLVSARHWTQTVLVFQSSRRST